MSDSSRTSARLRTYAGFVKFEHTIFSLPLIYAGAVLAGRGWPSARLSLLMLGAAAGGRTVAMGLNRIIDRAIDARNPRTQARELPAGRMTLVEAWLVVLAALAVYLGCAAAIAPMCVRWSPLPLALFVLYPYLKRFTALAHLGLGLAWATAPLGGWLAVRQSWSGLGEALWLAAFSVLWVAGFDILYAMQDVSVDVREKLHSLPAKLGACRAAQIAKLLHTAAWLALVALSAFALRPWIAAPFLMAISGLLFWEHHTSDLELAFFKINAALGFVVLALVWAGVSVV